MLSGEKNRLPVWLRNRPYNSMANALLPRAASARSDVVVAGTSAARKATGRTRQVLSNDLSGFMHISITGHTATGLRGTATTIGATRYRLEVDSLIIHCRLSMPQNAYKTSVGEISPLH
jgi:hypothetical protein